MKRSIVSRARYAALALATPAVLAGCAVAPVDASENAAAVAGGVSTAALIPFPQPIPVYDDPLVYCTSIPAGRTTNYTPNAEGPEFALQTEGVAPTASCDYDVFEIDGTSAGGYVNIRMTDTPSEGEGDSTYLPPPNSVTNAASCAESYVTYETMGYLPEHIVLGAGIGKVAIIPAAWVEAGSGTIYGTWITSQNRCSFTQIEQSEYGSHFPYQLSGVDDQTTQTSPYSKVRVAARMILITPQGQEWGPIFLYVN